MACGFGGGMRNGEICGAVSGAVMVIGMKYGHYNIEDTVQKSDCYQKTVEFTDEFRKKNHSIICKELLECNIATLEGMNEAKEKNLFTTTCVEMVASAVELLEELKY
jgi:C_GCAxxG_C_C family probable redox protein